MTSATLPCLAALADGGLDAVRQDALLRSGASTHRGALLNDAVAAAHGIDHAPVEEVLRS